MRKDGTRFWASGTLSVLNNAGQPCGFVKILRDSTDKKIAEETLRQAKRTADAASEAKGHFLATVSHELRTPLSAILLWTSNVAGKLRLEIRETHLPTVVHDGVNSARTAAQEKGIQIEENFDPKAETVQADGNRILQVVSNLVTKAVKFTPSDGRIAVDLRRFGDEVQISVSDTGIGIDRDSLPHIFERFMQVEGASTRTQTGLGLGLAVAKQIVEMHGGSIRVESRDAGQGATFIVSLPLPSCETHNGITGRGSRSQIPNLLHHATAPTSLSAISVCQRSTAMPSSARSGTRKKTAPSGGCRPWR